MCQEIDCCGLCFNIYSCLGSEPLNKLIYPFKCQDFHCFWTLEDSVTQGSMGTDNVYSSLALVANPKTARIDRTFLYTYLR